MAMSGLLATVVVVGVCALVTVAIVAMVVVWVTQKRVH